LENFDLDALPVTQFDGRNWEQSAARERVMQRI